MRRKRRLLIAIVILGVLLGTGFIAWKEFGPSDALAVGELGDLGDGQDGHWVRVRGRVEGNSLTWDANARRAQFVLTDGQDRLTVVYQGVLPDGFKPGAEVVVEGQHWAGRLEAYGFVTKSLCNLCHA